MIKNLRPVLLAVGVMALAGRAGADPVALRPSAEVGGPYVRLVDLIVPESLTPERAEAWSDVYLGALEPGGASRTIGREEIRAELRKRGPGADDLDWAGPDSVAVAWTPAAGDAIRSVLAGSIRDLLLREVPASATADLAVEILAVAPEVLLEDLAGACRVRNLVAAGAGPSARSRRFQATLEGADGSVPVSCSVTARIRQTQKGVRARRSLPAGSLLQPADLEIAAVAVEGVLRDVLTTIESLAGCRARARIEKGTLLTASLVQAPPVVRVRDPLVVTVHDATFQVALTYAAEALDAGPIGGQIRVQHAGNRRVGMATVSGPGRAEVVVDVAPGGPSVSGRGSAADDRAPAKGN